MMKIVKMRERDYRGHESCCSQSIEPVNYYLIDESIDFVSYIDSNSSDEAIGAWFKKAVEDRQNRQDKVRALLRVTGELKAICEKPG